ncbi:MAG: Mur ligase family protein, partial [Acidimicrobiales bacterium]
MIDVAAELTRRELDTVLVGFGVTNQAVARALLRAGHRAVVVDDHPVDRLRAVAHDIGVSLIEGPETSELSDLVERADAVFPAPGLPESHPAFDLAGEHGVAVAGELDLARAWDDRPIAAVTGTNGKTTVVDLTVTALRESGIRAMAAGNTDVPLVEAIDDASIDVFVVEASSFRLARAQAFAPRVATWLNFAPNHLAVHRDLQGYERANAAIWTHLPDDAVAVANAADPVVMSHLPSDRQVVTFGAHGDWRRDGDDLIGPS